MTKTYIVDVLMSRQEDGLWRAEVPGLSGCFVDADTIRDAINGIQECIAMIIDIHLEEAWDLPAAARNQAELPFQVSIPVSIQEFKFKRASKAKKATKALT